jgi:tetratricopeptide (TPR) repeat protein
MSKWFDATEAMEFAAALADQFSGESKPGSTPTQKKSPPSDPSGALQQILDRADSELKSRLNFYKKAKFANSFKWRLLENGVDKSIANDVTQRVLLHLARDQNNQESIHPSTAPDTNRSRSKTASELLNQGNKYMSRESWLEAITVYNELLELKPNHPDAMNNLGAALVKIGRYAEAEDCFRQTTRLHPNYPDAHSNLGEVLRARGRTSEAETWLRRALKLNPKHISARTNLGLTLVSLSRLSEAEVQFKKVLKAAPQNAEALFGMGHMATMRGHFDEADSMFNRAREAKPNLPSAWAAMAGLRKMTPENAEWRERSEQIAASGVSPLEEAGLRFAIGKYWDDVGDYKRAFQSYQRANELQREAAAKYDPDSRVLFVDDMIRVYSRESVLKNASSNSTSIKPVFVVGMPRSGTSLAEQIIASHPAARGAGELSFWIDVVKKHGSDIRQRPLDESMRKKLADDYLRDLQARGGDSSRIVDKAPGNADYLGIIHSVFPNARIIYMQRDPIDSCLSCYFQRFPVDLDFAMDLKDLAHYYGEHRRLMAHWRSVLPQGTILDVPYADLVADQELWTRKILDFLGLEWDLHCLAFHETERQVVTASAWQVRQKIYNSSVARWRNYEKYISPLLKLRI